MVITHRSPVNYFFSRCDRESPVSSHLLRIKDKSHAELPEFSRAAPTGTPATPPGMDERGDVSTLITLVTLREANLFLTSARLLLTGQARVHGGAAD
jgi:hypothetical protein